MGPWLHLDHTDDGTSYLGFAHAACNLRAGAQEGNRRQAQALGYTPHPRRATRAW